MKGITDSMDMNLGKLWDIVRTGKLQVCCSLWGCKESDTTEQQNNNNRLDTVNYLRNDLRAISKKVKCIKELPRPTTK